MAEDEAEISDISSLETAAAKNAGQMEGDAPAPGRPPSPVKEIHDQA
eukprot:COSAG04_NODE_16271_length_504_cov_1.916049_1_plen_46_part_01